jgi:hypothetical protein
VSTDDDPTAVADYASFIAYAAAAGQTPGDAPGQLPRGYLPMPANLQAQAQAAAASLGGAAPTISSNVTQSGSGSDSFDSGGSSLGDGGIDGQAATGGGAANNGNPPTVTPTSSPGPASVVKPTSTPTVYATPASAAPTARYAAIGIILAAAGGLAGRPLSRYFGRRRIGGPGR